MDGFWLKYIHTVGATLFFGAGLGTAFHMWAANRSGDVAAIAVVTRNVVWADAILIAPVAIAQPITGVLLAFDRGYPLDSGWILASLALYVFTGACWLWVVWLQIGMARLARAAVESGRPLPDAYQRKYRLWFLLGWPAFIAVLAIIYLMIFKPWG